MLGKMKQAINEALREITEAGLYKGERVITSPQGAWITLADGRKVLNLCSNNYLGLAGHPEVVAAAKAGIDSHGYGMSSVRFICGTQDIHKELERKVSEYLGTEDTILYSSCFDANGGRFETLLTKDDAIVSDALNHASIIDGVRLCKAARFRFATSDMADLDAKLVEAAGARFRLIATDGVFSMDGAIAKLDEVCDLADKHDALVMVDDSHATGFVGAGGRGSPEFRNVIGRVDVITSTFGKALGGASGGFTTGRAEIIELLRQRSRPYLFSNTMAPAVGAASLKALELVAGGDDLRERLRANTARFREGLISFGFNIPPGEHPITPIMLGDAKLAHRMADRLLEEGVYVIGFSFPVVPREQARIRLQASAARTDDDVTFALEKFKAVGAEFGISA